MIAARTGAAWWERPLVGLAVLFLVLAPIAIGWVRT